MSAASSGRRLAAGVEQLRDVVVLGGGTVVLQTLRAPGKESENEDGLLVMATDEGALVLAVADGMGGHPGGGAASRIALERLERSILEATGEGRELRDGILDGFEGANADVLERGTGAGTTLAVAEIADGTLRTYHVGDSAILQMGSRGRLKLQTILHSPTGYAVESGMMSEEDARVHEDRHVVSNVVGMRDMSIDMGLARPLAARDTVLLASDGLIDNVDADQIVDVLRAGPLEESLDALVRDCRGRMTSGGKPDDLTVIAWRRRA